MRGDLNPIFQGVYSSRIELKQRTRELERLLTTDEKLGVLLRWLGSPVDEEILWRAWEPMLFNQTHDLMSGVMTDHVYEDTIRGYDFSRRIADDEVQARLRKASAAIDTQGEGIAVAVWNMLGWPRTDIAVAEVGFSDGGIMDVSLAGPDGQAAPVQVLDSVRSGNGALLRAEVAFVARDVPALGYAVYRLLPVADAGRRRCRDAGRAGAGKRSLPPRIRPGRRGHHPPDRQTGAVERPERSRQRRGPGRGSRRSVGAVPQPGRRLRSPTRLRTRRLSRAKPSSATGRPPPAARSAAARWSPSSRSRIPSARRARFATTVRLYAGLRRIDIRTQILNNEKFVRYRALFPTSIRDGQSVHEIPFGAIERPAGIECPAQNWVDYGNGRQGVALLNRGLPGNNVADGTMMLSLLRSTRIQAYGYRRRLRAGHVVRFRLRVGQGVCVRLRPGSPCRRLASGGRLSRRAGVQPSAAGPRRGLAPRRAAQAMGVS